ASGQARPRPEESKPAQQPARQFPYQPPIQQEVDDTSPLIEDIVPDVHEPTPPASSTFGMDDRLLGTQPSLPTDNRQFGPDYDYRIGPPPPMRPIPPPSYEDDEPNLLLEDYQQSQSIRQAAQQNDEDTLLAPPAQIAPEATPQPTFEGARPQIIDLSSIPHDDDGPFTYLGDDQPASLPEQHASVPVHEMDDSAVDISDYPTDVLQIEDQGDMGDFVDRESSSSPSWTMPTLDEEEEQDMPGPSRIHGMRPRTNRTGKVFTTPPLPDFEEDDNELPPVYGQA